MCWNLLNGFLPSMELSATHTTCITERRRKRQRRRERDTPLFLPVLAGVVLVAVSHMVLLPNWPLAEPEEDAAVTREEERKVERYRWIWKEREAGRERYAGSLFHMEEEVPTHTQHAHTLMMS